MRRGKKKNTLEEFNIVARHAGHTYAEEQRQETLRSIGRIRAPRGEDGEPVYMETSAWNMLKNTSRAADGRK